MSDILVIRQEIEDLARGSESDELVFIAQQAFYCSAIPITDRVSLTQ